MSSRGGGGAPAPSVEQPVFEGRVRIWVKELAPISGQGSRFDSFEAQQKVAKVPKWTQTELPSVEMHGPRHMHIEPVRDPNQRTWAEIQAERQAQTRAAEAQQAAQAHQQAVVQTQLHAAEHTQQHAGAQQQGLGPAAPAAVVTNGIAPAAPAAAAPPIPAAVMQPVQQGAGLSLLPDAAALQEAQFAAAPMEQF